MIKESHALQLARILEERDRAHLRRTQSALSTEYMLIWDTCMMVHDMSWKLDFGGKRRELLARCNLASDSLEGHHNAFEKFSGIVEWLTEELRRGTPAPGYEEPRELIVGFLRSRLLAARKIEEVRGDGALLLESHFSDLMKTRNASWGGVLLEQFRQLIDRSYSEGLTWAILEEYLALVRKEEPLIMEESGGAAASQFARMREHEDKLYTHALLGKEDD